MVKQRTVPRLAINLRVGEDIAALAPHRPERARLTHSVLHSTAWPTVRCSDGRFGGQAADRLQPTAGTAPRRRTSSTTAATTIYASSAESIGLRRTSSDRCP